MRASIIILVACLALEVSGQQQTRKQDDSDAVNPSMPSKQAQMKATQQDIEKPEVSNHKRRFCSRQSMASTKQYLTYQLESTNIFNNIWFNDLDREELLEEQRASLASIIMANESREAEFYMNSVGQPTFEVEASYFRPVSSPDSPSIINMKVVKEFKSRCHPDEQKGKIVYHFAVSVGPFEHNLDVIYHLPRKLQLSQPIEWRYAQVNIMVQQMIYEIELSQGNFKSILDGCSLEVTDVTYLSRLSSRSQARQITRKAFEVVSVSGIALTNETAPNLDRFFDDYTRPAVSSRVKHALRFYLGDKTLPLEAYPST